jgi:D-aminopeptidase
MEEVRGKFVDNLKRNFKQIREDRAASIAEAAQVKFRRTVEDLELEIKKFEREQANMIDLSPGTTTSTVPAADFDEDIFIERYLDLAVKMRTLKIKLDLARESYDYLFGVDESEVA